jgi:hypothetical protein
MVLPFEHLLLVSLLPTSLKVQGLRLMSEGQAL